MASKSRGGLSKRELAAQKKVVPKPASRSVAAKKSGIQYTPKKVAIASNADGSVRYSDGTSSNAYASNVGETAGIVEARASAQDRGVLPKVAPKKSTPKKQSSSNNSTRSKAASFVNKALGVSTANASSEPNFTPADGGQEGISTRNLASKFTRGLSNVPGIGAVAGVGNLINQGADYLSGSNPVVDSGFKEGYNQTGIGAGIQKFNEAAGSLFGNDRLIGKDFGITEGLGLDGLLRKATGINTAEASNYDGTGGAEQNVSAPVSRMSDGISSSLAQPYQEDTQNTQNTQTYGQESQIAAPRVNTGGGLGTAQTAGTVGAGAVDPEMDAYVSDLQKSVKGDFGASEAKNQFKDLIRSLDPEYDAYLKQAETELNKSKTEDLNKLAGVFAGYNTADSEQRLQQQERVQGDYATQLAGILSKLMLQKQKDVTGYKTQASERLQEIAQAKSAAQQRVADLIQAAKDKAWDRNYKMTALNKAKGRAAKPTAADAPAIREIMNGLGVDVATAQKIYLKENGITGGNALDDILQQLVNQNQE